MLSLSLTIVLVLTLLPPFAKLLPLLEGQKGASATNSTESSPPTTHRYEYDKVTTSTSTYYRHDRVRMKSTDQVGPFDRKWTNRNTGDRKKFDWGRVLDVSDNSDDKNKNDILDYRDDERFAMLDLVKHNMHRNTGDRKKFAWGSLVDLVNNKSRTDEENVVGGNVLPPDYKWKDEEFPWRFRGDIDCQRKDLVDKIDFRSILVFERVHLAKPHHHYSQSEMCTLYMEHRKNRKNRRFWPHRLMRVLRNAFSVDFFNQYAGVAAAILTLTIGLRCLFVRKCKQKPYPTLTATTRSAAAAATTVTDDPETATSADSPNWSNNSSSNRRRQQRRRLRNNRRSNSNNNIEMQRVESNNNNSGTECNGATTTTLVVQLPLPPPAYSSPPTPAPTYEEAIRHGQDNSGSGGVIHGQLIPPSLASLMEEDETGSLPPSYDEAIKQINC